MSSAPLLSCRDVSKRFGPVFANQHIDLDVRAGQVQAILGENGAGKSTLMSVLAGRYRPDSGEIRVRGEAVRLTSPGRALRAGIGMVYQRFMLVERLTVAENVLLAAEGRGKRLSLRAVRRLVNELAQRYGLAVDPDRAVLDLSMGERQRVEILKLLVQDAEVLIFDEPTAVLAEPEVRGLFEVFRRLRADGRGVLFITHKLEEVLEVADFIAILRRGRIIARLKPEEIESRRELARLMVGREFVLRVDKEDVEPGETVLAVRGLTGAERRGRPAFEDVSFHVRRGEIVSVVGVAGNGQEQLAKAITGTGRPAVAGAVTFKGAEYAAPDWARVDKRGLAHVPEDRHHVGSVADMSLTENFLLTRLDASGGPWLDMAEAREDTEAAIAEYEIRAPGPDAPAGGLSGGNLQKLLLARELSRGPDLFVAEQPTQGLDIGATDDVWKAILAQRARSGVLLFSGDLREVLSLSDRIVVMFRGRVAEVIDALDQEGISRIGLLMAGGHAGEGEGGVTPAADRPAGCARREEYGKEDGDGMSANQVRSIDVGVNDGEGGGHV